MPRQRNITPYAEALVIKKSLLKSAQNSDLETTLKPFALRHMIKSGSSLGLVNSLAHIVHLAPSGRTIYFLKILFALLTFLFGTGKRPRGRLVRNCAKCIPLHILNQVIDTLRMVGYFVPITQLLIHYSDKVNVVTYSFTGPGI